MATLQEVEGRSL